jgi:hypothetical protein
LLLKVAVEVVIWCSVPSTLRKEEESAPALNILTGEQKEKAQSNDLSVYQKINGELNFRSRAGHADLPQSFPHAGEAAPRQGN